MNDNEWLERIDAWRGGSMTAAQEEEWLSLISDPENREQVLAIMQQLIDQSPPNENISHEHWQPVLDRILETDRPVAHPIVRRMRPWRWVAAASIILILGISGYLYTIQRQKGQTARQNPYPVKTDVPAPAVARAMLTLADGTTIALDSTTAGTITKQGKVTVQRSVQGEIIYNGINHEQLFNTLVNPRGSKAISLTLSDGSRVWLNAESSLRYPVAFVGNTREVELTGEGYFEVTHDPAKKFIVRSGSSATEVLGTRFNVKAYANEQTKITLIEGKVLVKASNKAASLAPRQQAEWSNNGWLINNSPDLEEVLAWKNERFLATGATVPDIMQQLIRYYDIEVHYEGSVTDKFGVNISRNVNLSQVLQMLELTGRVHFRIEGRNVYVKP